MTHYMRTVTWRFSDPTATYPGLPNEKIYVHAPADVVRWFAFLFKDIVNERFLVLWMNSANRVTGFEVVSEGILNSALVHPREVFRGAIVATAASIILVHNHPSENAEPSSEDLDITRQLVEAGRVTGIPVRDHVIVAGESYTSFAERGLL